MSISKETEERIIENNKVISQLLLENEKILRDCGFNPPEENYVVNEDGKIKFPSGYIRPKEYLVQKYHLEEIASNWKIRSNIGYAIQLSDFHNYIINRFHLWGSVETMFYKSAVINLISIIEALVFECVNNICHYSSNCKVKRHCDKSFNVEQRNNVFKALQQLNILKIISFSEKEMNRINELIDLRNRVHIRLANEKEFLSKCFNLSLYNEVIALLQSLSEQIYNNGVPLYYHCSDLQNDL